MKLGWILWLVSMLGGTVQEQTCLAATVYLEARDQPIEGQYAVAEVALRRRESGRWGSTVCAVVKSTGQFAPTLLPRDYPMRNVQAWQRAWKVAGNSLHNWRLPPDHRTLYVPGATHFFAHGLADPPWVAFAKPVAVIGGHSFFRVDDAKSRRAATLRSANPSSASKSPAVLLEREEDAASARGIAGV